MLEKIKACFAESIQTQIASAEILPDAIARAAIIIVYALLDGNKILCCGSGGSAVIAQRFVSNMINQFETERPSLPALCLNTDNAIITSIINGQKPEEVYAKQVRALGESGDILFVIATKGDDSNVVIKAVEASLTRDMIIVALTGHDGGELAGLLGTRDVEIRIPSERGIRIQEVHLLTVNCLCDLIDNALFPHQDS
ncbi:MAG: SIS domain-containing protein [Arsenophonus sp.]